MKRMITALLIAVLSSFALPLAADTADEEAIRATALDYALSWYAGDAARMERALAPELAKRIVGTDKESGKAKVDQMDAARLIEGVRRGYGTKTPTDQQLAIVTILDRFGNAASVRVEMSGWIDYMHVGKIDGQWKIINVLWERKPVK